MDTIGKLQDIFREVFDDKDLVITRETSSDDIEGWDSLAQISIIAACEYEYGIKFNLNDVAKVICVGDIVEIIEGKIIR